jgi:hypothetical protein
VTTDADRLRIFRTAARGLTPASAIKVMRELYDEMGISAKFSAEIWLAEQASAGKASGT